MLGNSYISNLNKILRFCDLNCSNKPDLLTSSAIREIISKLQNKYSEYWKSKISSSIRLEFFTRIKQRYERGPFLNVVKNVDVKRTYKFRTSNHSLYIETGRYYNPVIPRGRLLCKFCSANETEDELHFLLKCNLYNDLRQLFFKKLKAVTGVDSTDHLNTIFPLFTSLEPILTTHRVNYIHKSGQMLSKMKRNYNRNMFIIIITQIRKMTFTCCYYSYCYCFLYC